MGDAPSEQCQSYVGWGGWEFFCQRTEPHDEHMAYVEAEQSDAADYATITWTGN